VLVVIIVRAGGPARTSVVAWVDAAVSEARQQAGRILYGFQQWLLDDQAAFERWAPTAYPNPGALALPRESLPPPPKRPGPSRKPHNVWAIDQLTSGKTTDEILDEYMRMRGDDTDDPDERERARESIAQAIRRARKGIPTD
jgi:hypothetical protein